MVGRTFFFVVRREAGSFRRAVVVFNMVVGAIHTHVRAGYKTRLELGASASSIASLILFFLFIFSSSCVLYVGV